MPSSKGNQIKANTKSERIVLMRLNGVPYKKIAEAEGCSVGSARVLFWKRKRKCRRMLANMTICR
jgi:DNA-directed RNA polymerase specialized sigma24 family protein